MRNVDWKREFTAELDHGKDGKEGPRTKNSWLGRVEKAGHLEAVAKVIN